MASVAGDDEKAVNTLRQAIDLCDAAGVDLFAAAARHRLGRLLDGDEGRALVVQAETWMRAQSVREPARMAACMVPGFPRIR